MHADEGRALASRPFVAYAEGVAVAQPAHVSDAQTSHAAQSYYDMISRRP